jgi:hypothetical protein
LHVEFSSKKKAAAFGSDVVTTFSHVGFLFCFFKEGLPMANITLSPLVTDIRGKQKDTVFSKWRGQNYIRSRVKPSNPQTGGQMAVRDALSAMVIAFQKLNARQLETVDGDPQYASFGWNYAATGLRYSGFNMFMKVNRAAYQNDGSVIASPASGAMTAPTVSAATGSGATKTVALTCTPTSLSAHQYLCVLIQDLTDSLKPVVDVQVLTPGAGAITVACPKAGNSYGFHVFTVDDAAKKWSSEAVSVATSHA